MTDDRPVCPYPETFLSECPVSGHVFVPGEGFPRHAFRDEAPAELTPEERIEAARREMIQKLIVPQLERFTAWLESRGIEPTRFRPGGREVTEVWTWPELMQEWYREMEAFS